MITEDYVSFEIAKLLKEKGFDGECDLFYRTDEPKSIIHEASKIAYSQGIDDECVITPTLQMAMKWLRKEHNLSIEPYYTHKQGYKFAVQEIPTAISLWMDLPDELYSTYEEACETAIKYCLENLI